jgi:hypothetical protein
VPREAQLDEGSRDERALRAADEIVEQELGLVLRPHARILA